MTSLKMHGNARFALYETTVVSSYLTAIFLQKIKVRVTVPLKHVACSSIIRIIYPRHCPLVDEMISPLIGETTIANLKNNFHNSFSTGPKLPIRFRIYSRKRVWRDFLSSLVTRAQQLNSTELDSLGAFYLDITNGLLAKHGKISTKSIDNLLNRM